MKCTTCNERAVFSNPKLCKNHFTSYFEGKVKDAIRRFRLFSRKDRVAVAASGGKDSTVLLHLLRKLGYNVEALAIDEGIKGYRDKTLEILRKFCNGHETGKIRLRIYSYKKEFGAELDKMLTRMNYIPCSICGTFRRYLLNKMSRGYDKLATGHNLDDEAQSIMMNYLKNNLSITARLGPSSGIARDKKFVNRVKPLYFCSEKEVMAYSFLHGLQSDYSECPHAPESFRAKVRDALNEYERARPGTKKMIVERFVEQLPMLKQHFRKIEKKRGLAECENCGEPSHSRICKACQYSEEYSESVKARVKSPRNHHGNNDKGLNSTKAQFLQVK